MISSPVWKFFDFGYMGSGAAIENWYQGQEEETQDMFDETVEGCRNVQNHLDWPHFKHLHGKSQQHGIWEIGFRSERREYRILGIFDGAKRAVLLGACFHKQKVYMPPGTIDEACHKVSVFRRGEGQLHERKNKSA